MTSLTSTKNLNNDQRSVPQHFGIARIIMWTLLFQLAWSWNTLKKIVNDGMLLGPDDFMRLVQVRGLLAGQDWFDQTAYRMTPPAGADIHWSRLIDAPIAGFIYVFSPFFGQQLAERITAIVWPSLLLVLTVLVIVKICDALISNYNRLLPVFFTVLCVTSLGQFSPGRIDHHNVQILLYACLLWSLINWRLAIANIAAGIIIPLSISIGLDVAAFIILFLAWFGLEWVVGNDKHGASLKRFALSMFFATIGLYGINISPDNWFSARCDANSFVYFSALISISVAMVLMASLSSVLSGPSSTKNVVFRLMAGVVLGMGCVAILLMLFPHCANGPYGALSEELNTRWLSQVVEAKTIFAVLEQSPEFWIKTVAYCALVLAIGAWVLTQDIANKNRVAVIYAAFAIAVLLSAVQFRVIAIGFFASVPVCVLATELIARKLARKLPGKSTGEKFLKTASIVLSVILLSSTTWAIIGGMVYPQKAEASINQSAVVKPEIFRKTCFLESDYAKLAKLPKGQVLSDLNSASPILVFTHHTVLTGPYHRNQAAILDVLDFFQSEEKKARQISARNNIEYVTLCRTVKSPIISKEHANTIRGLIYSGETPLWMEAVSTNDDKVFVFRVKN